MCYFGLGEKALLNPESGVGHLINYQVSCHVMVLLSLEQGRTPRGAVKIPALFQHFVDAVNKTEKEAMPDEIRLRICGRIENFD